MIDKLSRLAEQVATNVSRRGFMGRVGKGAMAVAATVCGMLGYSAVAEEAAEDEKKGGHGCCGNGKCPKPTGQKVKFRGTENCRQQTARCVWIVDGQRVTTPCT